MGENIVCVGAGIVLGWMVVFSGKQRILFLIIIQRHSGLKDYRVNETIFTMAYLKCNMLKSKFLC